MREPAEPSQFLAYATTLRRRKWTIILIIAVAVAVAVGLTYAETPIYRATANVLLQTAATEAAVGGSLTTPDLPDEIQRMQSPAIAALVTKQLGVAPQVTATNLTGTDVMEVSVESSSPAEASDAANAYANAYIQYRQTETVNAYTAAAKDIESQISSLQSQLSAIPGASSVKPGSAPSSNPQVSGLNQQITVLNQQLSALNSSESLGVTSAQVIKPATTPTSPSSPRKVRDGLLGLGGGLVVGVAVAVGRDALDDRISAKEDIDRAQPGLPVLGLIPAVSNRNKTIEVISSSRPHSTSAEAYRSLRTSIQFLTLERPVRMLQVTSPRTTEGKTTTVANLAVALANAGQRVIIVDCDLRRPRIHDFFGLANAVGLTSVLSEQLSLESALQSVPEQEGLRLLASGETPPNPSELLSARRTGEVLGSLQDMADVVLVDSPPVLPVTDAAVLSARMDAILVVVSAGRTTRRDLSRALEIMAQVDAPVVGAVLNGITTQAGYRYRYAYEYTPNGARAPRVTKA